MWIGFVYLMAIFSCICSLIFFLKQKRPKFEVKLSKNCLQEGVFFKTAWAHCAHVPMDSARLVSSYFVLTLALIWLHLTYIWVTTVLFRTYFVINFILYLL